MYDTGIFVFGTKIFEKPRRDSISCLPLELSWKIFSYLDKASLRNATQVHKVWKRIIIANKNLRSRLNQFELVFKLGSENLVKFYKRNKKILKKLHAKNYLPVGQSIVSRWRQIDTSGAFVARRKCTYSLIPTSNILPVVFSALFWSILRYF